MIRAGQYLSRHEMVSRLVDAYYCGLWEQNTDIAEKLILVYEKELVGKSEIEIGELYVKEFEEGL